MSYKDLLVVLDSDAPARGRIEIAAALAERFAAHLVALYPLPVPEAPRHFGYYDPALLNPFFEEWRARAREAADKTRALFDRITGLRGVSVSGGKFPRRRTPIPRFTPVTLISQFSANSTPMVVNPIRCSPIQSRWRSRRDARYWSCPMPGIFPMSGSAL